MEQIIVIENDAFMREGDAMEHVILVEDDTFMREELEEIFQKAGYRTSSVTEFGHATDSILQMEAGLVLLDLNLPGISGFQICRELKQKRALPILVLTSRDQLRDELHALGLGADEFLTKPCRQERLLARAANLLRRYEGREHLLEGPGFLLDQQTYTLYIHGQSSVLPKNQGKLLETFLLHRGEILTKDALCTALWGTAEYVDENALQVNLTRLKKSMRSLGIQQQVAFVRGEGYQLADAELGRQMREGGNNQMADGR